MRLAVQHRTHYGYEQAVRSSIQYLRLQPRSSTAQQIESWQLTLPDGHQPPIIRDGFDNLMQVFVLERPHREIVIEARGVVILTDRFNGRLHDSLEPLPFVRPTPLTLPDEALTELAWHHLGQRRDLAALCTLQEAILAAMPYRPGVTEVWYPPGKPGASARGSVRIMCMSCSAAPA
ncbi:transglutaminase N-terminal domain-containing protein [Kushneria phosphatilytica]|uniref:transglutaminase N-terminal domain-containing protein n=1 Tax=Kushneria phosphatilytica TaxID=657387 RepID=UPI0019815D50|nr:transglutaminase N-terminal domain-containing protein [Kushneria phosphatilytica]